MNFEEVLIEANKSWGMWNLSWDYASEYYVFEAPGDVELRFPTLNSLGKAIMSKIYGNTNEYCLRCDRKMIPRVI